MFRRACVKVSCCSAIVYREAWFYRIIPEYYIYVIVTDNICGLLLSLNSLFFRCSCFLAGHWALWPTNTVAYIGICCRLVRCYAELCKAWLGSSLLVQFRVSAEEVGGGPIWWMARWFTRRRAGILQMVYIVIGDIVPLHQCVPEKEATRNITSELTMILLLGGEASAVT